MNNGLANALNAAMKAMESFQNNPVLTWNGVDYICDPDIYTTSATNNKVGIELHNQFKFKIRLDQFNGGNIPQSGTDFIYYSGDKLKITEIQKPNHNLFWILVCRKLTTK